MNIDILCFTGHKGLLGPQGTGGLYVKEGTDIRPLLSGGSGERLPVTATISGLLRGLIRDGYPVSKGFKIADVDPRKEEYGNCFTVSDKSRCIAGGVLEAILTLKGRMTV